MPSMRLAKTAAALMVLAAGFGSPLLAQSEQPLDPMGANYWTGTWTYIEDSFTPPGSETLSEGVGESLGSKTSGEVAADDPRIAGTRRGVFSSRAATSVESAEGALSITNGTVRIDNADGAWVGTSTGFGGYPGQEGWFVMEGEGAYEGLTTVFRWHAADSSLEGIIVPVDLPALPDPVAPPTTLG